MIILTLRTDKPEAEIGLYNDDKQLVYETWQAHRQLAETIHVKIREILKSQSKDWPDINGTVCYQGPGSFTGLRIGLTAANVLADSLPAAIVGSTGEGWIEKGIERLQRGENQKLVLPEYGSPVHITLPKS